MAQSNVGEDGFGARSVHILVSEVGPIRAELFGELGVKPWGIEYARDTVGSVAHQQDFVEPFKLWADQHGVRRKDSFSDSREICWREQVAVSGKTYLQAANCVRTGEKCKVEGLMVLVINHVLHRFVSHGGTRGTPVPDFCDVVQAEMAGGDQARRRRTHSMNRQNSSAVLELKEKGAPRRCLKPSAMVISGVVITDGGMISANSEPEKITVGVLNNHAFDIHTESIIFSPCFAENVVRPTFKDNFTEELKFFRDVGSDEKVELAKAEGGRIVPLVIPVKGDIAETAHAQQCLAGIHPLRHGVVGLRLSFTYRRRTRLGGRRWRAYRGSLLLGPF